MKQHAPARLFPAAAIVVIIAWAVNQFADIVLPAEVAAAGTALIGYLALFTGLSSGDAPPADPFAGIGSPPADGA